MTNKAPVHTVVCQRDTAVRTFINKSAFLAGNKFMCAAPVQKEDTLFSPFKVFIKFCPERSTDAAIIPTSKFIFQINDLDLREFQFVIPSAQNKV